MDGRHNPVATAFAEVVESDAGAGAQFVAYLNGRQIVTLHAGVCTNDTLVPVFSGTKGLVALCAALMVDRGRLDLDAPVALYWPEFATQHKDGILVRHVLSHQAGLPFIDGKVSWSELYDCEAMTARLAAQRPLWPPGQKICYHAMTFGLIVTELIRRIDGRGVGEFIRDEIARPLHADVWLGLPEAEHHRVAPVVRHPAYRTNIYATDPDKRSLVERIYGNPPLLTGEPVWNSTEYRYAGTPSGGAFATAEGMSRVYACLACGGTLGDTRLLDTATLRMFTAPERQGIDAATERPLAFGIGFETQDTQGTYGPEETAFGHSGAGGSVHGSWPRLRASFSFTTCLMRSEGQDGRSTQILRALRELVLNMDRPTDDYDA